MLRTKPSMASRQGSGLPRVSLVNYIPTLRSGNGEDASDNAFTSPFPPVGFSHCSQIVAANYSFGSEYISGVILYHETLLDFQLGPVLSNRGIIPGVRADTDAHPLPISPIEPATQGLDHLLPRLRAAAQVGARFSKWRASILCNSSTLPTHTALEVQAESLARFAAISQQAGLVPIVEPDVDFAEDADLQRSVDVHVKIISMIYARCAAYGVLLEGMCPLGVCWPRCTMHIPGSLITPSFPQPGLKHPSRANTPVEAIGLATATVLARSTPVSVAGIVFLSGKHSLNSLH